VKQGYSLNRGIRSFCLRQCSYQEFVRHMIWSSKLEKIYFNTNVYNAIPHWTLTYCFPLTM
jgi:hypothetical protein